MPPFETFVEALKHDYPQLSFQTAEDHWWDPLTHTVYYNQLHEERLALLLHELSHAILEHKEYLQDIELLQIEREAWHYAIHTLAPRYQLSINQDVAEDSLETYRIWLHNRSLCPRCSCSALQQLDGSYQCPLCMSRWRANEARTRHLRRYLVSN